MVPLYRSARTVWFESSPVRLVSTSPEMGRRTSEEHVLERIEKILGPGELGEDFVHRGDDGAVLAPLVGRAIVSTDTAVAGVHLDLEIFSLEDLGYRAVTTALSDIAAMGARPRGVVVALSAATREEMERVTRGVADAARDTGVAVVGGDLTTSRPVSVTVTVLGDVPHGEAVTRTGARPGDVLLVTGPLGGSAAGLRRARAGTDLDDDLVRRHRRPQPRLREGQLAQAAGVHAMMDLSDGLALDLHRLADASGVGFVVHDVPVDEGATEEEALSGGEDYELLIVTDDPDKIVRAFVANGVASPLVIGEVVSDVTRRRYGAHELIRRGYRHEVD